ncbi:MAG: glycine--tRNA ligase subunit beta [Thermaerobacter sp.]|nr:MAG: glycine--tRNA ligase subunit beta [Bacillota bacterium]
MSRLAFEIGCEEIPARFVPTAAAGLEAAARAMFEELRLKVGRVQVLASPRRLILMAGDVAEVQEDLVEWVRGPSRAAAFDQDGRPTRAAEGFARSQGVAVQDLEVRETPQGPYVFARRHQPGRPARQVLPAALSDLPGRIEFPRAMRWGPGQRFIRPVRWLLALLDDEVLPASFAGVEAGRLTRGHRTLAPGPHPVPHAADLPEVLRRAFVLADRDQRRRRVLELVQEAAAAQGGEAVVEESTLEEVTDLVEWPTAFTGSFAPEYLDLPEELLMTTMRVHQRYFPVRGGDGRLMPLFVAVRNGDDTGLDVVRAGNEKVLRARLADAKFFYDEDRRQPLAGYVPRLANVAFLEGLGSLLDKTRRLERLVEWLAGQLGVAGDDRAHALRAAHLAKADQVTDLVFEFPELEGIAGREYARHSGEPEPVAQALAEQYLPRPGSAALPVTVPGRLLAAADRLDTLAGAFAAGLEPTGSHDPYGLRRHALALLNLCREAGLGISLSRALSQALDGYGDLPAGRGAEDREGVLRRLAAFLQGRLEGLLREAGVRPDLVDAVLAAGSDVVPDVWDRAAAGQRLLDSAHFDDVYTAFRRAYNLSRNFEGGEVDPSLFEHDAERRLHEDLEAVAREAAPLLEAGEYDEFYRVAARLRPPVDRFLDDVLVMAEDEGVRRNRLALLRGVADLVGRPLDLSRLAV